ncbi:MAG: MMPL family transporter [Desulfovibrionaceae bacterium]|nr:MMPL family transporter [Desulfovibrionaceae bacterium]
MRLTAELLESAPASNMLCIDLEGDAIQELLDAAAAIERAVSPELAKPVRFSPASLTPERILEIFPSFFSSDMEKQLDGRLEDKAAEELFRQNRQQLSGMGGMLAAPWVRGDPLQLRVLLREQLPAPDIPALYAPGAAHYPVSPDNRHVLLMLRPHGSALDTTLAQKLMRAIDGAVQPFRGITVHMSGGPRYTAANARAVENDIRRIALFSLAGFSLAYFLLARSWGALWILLTPAAATLAAAALTSRVWPVTSGLVLGFGASLMGLAEDYAVHMHFALRSGTDTKNIYASLLTPLLYGFLLNISGFFVLLFSSIPAIRQMAFFSCCSLSAGFFLAVFVLPFLPYFSYPRNIHYENTIIMSKHSTSRNKAILLYIMLLGLCSFFWVRTDINFSPYALGADARAISSDAAMIRDTWQIDTGITIALVANSREAALAMSRLCAEKLRDAGLKGVRALSDFLPLALEARANCARWEQWLQKNRDRLRGTLERAARHEGFLPTAFLPFWQSLDHPVRALSAESSRITELRLNDMVELLLFDRASGGSCALVSCQAPASAETIAALKALLPAEWQGQVFFISPGLMENSFTLLFTKEKQLVYRAGLLALILLAVLLRRPSRIWMASMPPLLSLTTALAIFWLTGVPLTMASLAALPIVLGLALDHGIMVTHALEHRQEMGIRRAVLLSSLTAFLSMGLLAFSEHPALRGMGLVIFSGLAAELAAALWILPLMYATTGKER